MKTSTCESDVAEMKHDDSDLKQKKLFIKSVLRKKMQVRRENRIAVRKIASREMVLEGLLRAAHLAEQLGQPGAMVHAFVALARIEGYEAPRESKVTIEHLSRKPQLADMLKRIVDNSHTIDITPADDQADDQSGSNFCGSSPDGCAESAEESTS